MTYLLHIDTSMDTGAVAISADGRLLNYGINRETRNHAGTLNLMIDDLMRDTKVTFDELSAIVVCGGPGSYTGLRIGLATAKGLCYALDKPLIMDNRLTLMAHAAWLKNGVIYSKYISILIARSKEYFISIYDNSFACILAPQHITEEQLSALALKDENVFIISNAPESTFIQLGVNNFEIDTNIETDLKSWALGAFEEYKCNNIVNFATAEPFYLKQVYTHK